MLSPLRKTLIWPNLEAQSGAGLHPTLSTGITRGKTPTFPLSAADFPWSHLCLFSYFCFSSYLASVYFPRAPPAWAHPSSSALPCRESCSCLQPQTRLLFHKGSVDAELNIHREPQNTADFRAKGKKNLTHFSLGLFLS